MAYFTLVHVKFVSIPLEKIPAPVIKAKKSHYIASKLKYYCL